MVRAAVKSDTKTDKVQKDIKKKGFGPRGDEGMVDFDIAIDASERYTGVVAFFEKRRGFGFISLDQKGLLPEDKLMVVWKAIESSDRWPSLNRDMKVEFNIEKFEKRDKSGAFVKAKSVTLPGGSPIEIQDGSEDKKEYVGGDKALRYTGNVVWFDWKKGFGFVKIDDGYDIPDDVPKEIRVHREEISSGKDAPHLRDNMPVEFGISKNAKNNYAVYNLTLPGGEEVTRAAFLNREDLDKTTYNGTIRSFLGGFGWVEPENKNKFPARAQTKLAEMTKKRSKGGDSKDEWIYLYRDDVITDTFVDRGQKCTFKLHVSDKGLGAHDVIIKN